MKNVGGSSSNKKCHLSLLAWKHQFLWCVKTVDGDLSEEDKTGKDQLRYCIVFDLQFTMWCWCGCTKSNNRSSKWVIAMTSIDILIYSNHTSLNSTPDIDWHQNLIEIHRTYQSIHVQKSFLYIFLVFPTSMYTFIYVNIYAYCIYIN